MADDPSSPKSLVPASRTFLLEMYEIELTVLLLHADDERLLESFRWAQQLKTSAPDVFDEIEADVFRRVCIAREFTKRLVPQST